MSRGRDLSSYLQRLISIALGQFPYGLTDYFKYIIAKKSKKSNQTFTNWKSETTEWSHFLYCVLKRLSEDTGETGPEASFLFQSFIKSCVILFFLHLLLLLKNILEQLFMRQMVILVWKLKRQPYDSLNVKFRKYG
jgi:hypothetical protein